MDTNAHTGRKLYNKEENNAEIKDLRVKKNKKLSKIKAVQFAIVECNY